MSFVARLLALLFLVFFVIPSAAFAKDRAPDRHNTGLLGRPAITVDEKDCRLEIAAQFVEAGVIDDIILADAQARAICAESAGNLEQARARVKVIEAEADVVRSRAGNDFVVAAGLSTAAGNGGSTAYESSPTGTTKAYTGPAATEFARAQGFVTWQQGMNPAFYGVVDPRLDASAMLAAQAYSGFQQAQVSTEVWRSQAAAATMGQAETEQQLAATKASAAAAKKEAAQLRKERDALATDMATMVSEP